MHMAARMRRVIPSDIRERMKYLPDRRIIHLGGDLPDPALLPVAAFAEACAAIFAAPDQARIALQYTPSEGHGPLRDWLAEEMGALWGRVAAPTCSSLTVGRGGECFYRMAASQAQLAVQRASEVFATIA